MRKKKSAAEIRVLFAEWVISHSRAEFAMEIMNDLREARRIAKRGTEASAAYILAPSQSGKSHTVTHAYNKKYLIPECRASNWCDKDMSAEDVVASQEKVLYVKLPPKPHLGALAVALLEAIGDLKPTKGTVPERLIRFKKQFLNGGWELLILDSFDHLTKPGAIERDAATETQDALKIMIEQGIPMLFVGLPSARDGVLGEFQLGVRSEEIPFGPINLETETDLVEFEEFLSSLDILMVEEGVFPDYSDLAEKYLEALHYACLGRLGLVSDIVRDAAIRASRRNARCIEPIDLEEATNKNSIELKLRVVNVFRIAREKKEAERMEFNPLDIASPSTPKHV